MRIGKYSFCVSDVGVLECVISLILTRLHLSELSNSSYTFKMYESAVLYSDDVYINKLDTSLIGVYKNV